jgi:hypothetical protein
VQEQINKNKIQLFFTFIFGICILCFLIYKASHTSFTHDEAFTYTRYVHQSFFDILSFNHPYLNNHILNTLLMKYSEMFFGKHELSLRLPAILAFVLYSVFIVLWSLRNFPTLLLPIYLLFTLNPYLLDFFCLARGYGLSIGFLMASIYYLTTYFKTKKTKYLVLHHIVVLLAIFSNFSMLNYFVVSFIVFNIIELIQHHKAEHSFKSFSFLLVNRINFLCFIIYFIFLFEPIRRLLTITLLDFGGKQGFLSDTVTSLIEDLFYDYAVSSNVILALKIFTVIVFLCSVFILLRLIFVKKRAEFINNYNLVFVSCIIIGMILISIVQHVIIGNDYYVHRFAIFYYPLFIALFCVFSFYLIDVKFLKILICTFSMVVIALMINLYKNHSLTYYKDWKWDMNTNLIVKQIIQEKKHLPNKNIQLGCNWLFEPTINFYRYIWNISEINPAHRRGVSNNDDYWYVFSTDNEFITVKNKNLLFLNKETKAALLKISKE